MNEMNEQQATQWRKRRTMGKGKYVMYFGILTWGIAVTAIITGMEWLTQHTFQMSWLYIRLIVFASIGFFISVLRWEARERKFKSYLAKKGASE
ncbi:hypothetical protein [Paenibacillus periandrae]|uniref:hypothetical protein n=1 Tax=Paenibacillus periandrae TaxID=1761741 RepID=UPI001F0893BC|nr:hypothetical protein [Paenibacillus periandrae]